MALNPAPARPLAPGLGPPGSTLEQHTAFNQQVYTLLNALGLAGAGQTVPLTTRDLLARLPQVPALQGDVAMLLAGMPGYIYGCELANNAGDATNDIDFGAGVCAAQDGLTLMRLPALTKQLDAAWAPGNDAGGLFPGGSPSDTTYHCFVIASLDGRVDAGFDTSVTADNRPADYVLYRRILSLPRESGALVGFVQTGGSVQRADGGTNDVAANNPGTDPVLQPLSVPVGIRVLARFLWEHRDDSLTAISSSLVTSLAQTATAPGAGAYTTRLSSTNARQALELERWTDDEGRIRYELEASDADISVAVNLDGWFDLRGANA